MATFTQGTYLSLQGREEVQQAQPTGMLEVCFVARYLKVRRTLDGHVVFADRKAPLIPNILIPVPTQVLLQPLSHKNFLSGAVSTLKLPPCPNCSRDHVPELIASHALLLSAAPAGFVGYSMVAELQFYAIEEFVGVSRSTIEKLINNGGIAAADRSDQELLGTCSICLEELSPSDGAALLRMDCSHLYHQSCILPWLEKQSSCPYCRREVDQE